MNNREFLRSTDVCPEGQKDARGKPNPEWAGTRDKLLITGTTLGKIVPPDHPFYAGSGNADEVIDRFVFGYSEPVSDYVKKYIFQPGNDGEEVAVKLFCETYHATLFFPGLLVHRTEEMWGGSPDGVDAKRNYIVEIKTLVKRKFAYTEEKDGKRVAVIPQRYVAQPQWYMWLTGIEKCAFLQYENDTGHMEVNWVYYRKEDMETALEHAAAFTERVLEMRVAYLESLKEIGGLWERFNVFKDEHPRTRLRVFDEKYAEVRGRLGEVVEEYSSPLKKKRASRPRVVSSTIIAKEEVEEVEEAPPAKMCITPAMIEACKKIDGLK